MESFRGSRLTYFERLLSIKSDKERRGYVDMLYRSYFNKDGSVNTNKVKMDKNIIEEFIEDCRGIRECGYGVDRFSLLLQVV